MRCPGVFGPTVVPLVDCAEVQRSALERQPPPLGGGGVVGIVVDTSFEGALLRPEVFSA